MGSLDMSAKIFACAELLNYFHCEVTFKVFKPVRNQMKAAPTKNCVHLNGSGG